jgi:hypothetical protein
MIELYHRHTGIATEQGHLFMMLSILFFLTRRFIPMQRAGLGPILLCFVSAQLCHAEPPFWGGEASLRQQDEILRRCNALSTAAQWGHARRKRSGEE